MKRNRSRRLILESHTDTHKEEEGPKGDNMVEVMVLLEEEEEVEEER
jgi:hypothetical protein